jgi:hypothetical protein
VSSPPRDLVFRVGYPGEELRYAIRTQHNNIPHHNIITAGVRPTFTTCRHINTPRPPGTTKHAHAWAVLWAILTDPHLTEEIILSDDDMYPTRPITTMGSYTTGPISNTHATTRTRWQAIRDTMAITGPDAPMLDTHTPTIINRTKLANTLTNINLPTHRLHRLLWRTIHGPTGPLTTITDAKIRAGRPDWSAPWISTADHTAQNILPHLAQLHPTPCPAEHPTPH